jgi:hypothetical protein
LSELQSAGPFGQLIEEPPPAFDKKSIPMVAWYMLSKESYMNRVIKEVLPTIHAIRIRLGDRSTGTRGEPGTHTTLFAKEDQSAHVRLVVWLMRDACAVVLKLLQRIVIRPTGAGRSHLYGGCRDSDGMRKTGLPAVVSTTAKGDMQQPAEINSDGRCKTESNDEPRLEETDDDRKEKLGCR